jgi:uncharacterized protein HemX
MPEGRRLTPRIRMPRVTRPGRSSRDASEKDTATRPKEAAKAGNGANPGEPKETNPTPAKPAAGAKTPEPNLQERIEGLQGWMAELERKQARLTYFGALALLLALGAAGVALYFGLTTHSDSATKNDLDELTTRVDSLQGALTKNSTEAQNAINASVAQLQQTITGLQKQQAKAAANLSTLQSQVASAKKAAAGAATTPPAAGSTTTTTPTTPDAGKKNP